MLVEYAVAPPAGHRYQRIRLPIVQRAARSLALRQAPPDR